MGLPTALGSTPATPHVAKSIFLIRAGARQMRKLVGMILNLSLCLMTSSSHADSDGSPKTIHDSEVREISSRRYTELLRVACFNGFRYRQADITHGYLHHYEELRRALIDQGVVILPDAKQSQLIIASIITGGGLPGKAAPEPGCFRARWSGK